MTRLALSGLCLTATAALAPLRLLNERGPADLTWGATGWLALAGAALAYRSLVGARRHAVPALALAVLGLSASAWTVDATVRLLRGTDDASPAWMVGRAVTGPGWADVVPLLVLAGGGAGLALLAWATVTAHLVHPAVAWVVAVAAATGSILAEPSVHYLLGAGPLGVALLAAAGPTARHQPPAPERTTTRTGGVS